MTFGVAERLARSLLFEGYVLYPYRASSLKNRQRWAFGSLLPPSFCAAAGASDQSRMQTECLVIGREPRLRISVRFLQLGRTPNAAVPDATSFQQAVERSIDPEEIWLKTLHGEERRSCIHFSAAEPSELQPATDGLDASVTLTTARLESELWRVRVEIRNESELEPSSARAQAMLRTLVSTHTLLGCEEGRFVSLLEPEPEHAHHARACKNEGTWPILVGAPGAADTMLSSPIILYDHPKVAPESAGDLFDSTEIDEILTLRILTLTEDERREVLRTDPRARALLERTEALDEEDLLRLHGAWRSPEPDGPRTAESERTRSGPLGAGDHVVIRPRPHGDVMDLALAGEAATVVKVEEDLEGRFHYAVTIDCDPGKDLGEQGQPGHRFFFSADELERLS